MPIYCDVCEGPIDREEELTRIDGRDFCLDCYALTTKPVDRYSIIGFLSFLELRGWLYHFDDDPHEIQVWTYPSGRDASPPSEDQLDLIEAKVAECLKLDEDYTWKLAFRGGP
jgi:hypothetical protein